MHKQTTLMIDLGLLQKDLVLFNVYLMFIFKCSLKQPNYNLLLTNILNKASLTQIY